MFGARPREWKSQIDAPASGARIAQIATLKDAATYLRW
jgi:hypothetical protein